MQTDFFQKHVEHRFPANPLSIGPVFVCVCVCFLRVLVSQIPAELNIVNVTFHSHRVLGGTERRSEGKSVFLLHSVQSSLVCPHVTFDHMVICRVCLSMKLKKKSQSLWVFTNFVLVSCVWPITAVQVHFKEILFQAHLSVHLYHNCPNTPEEPFGIWLLLSKKILLVFFVFFKMKQIVLIFWAPAMTKITTPAGTISSCLRCL